MFRILVDHNFNQRILRGVLRRVPNLDYVTTQLLGLASGIDPLILERAAADHRIVLTHDVATMIDFAEERIAASLPMPGLVIIREELPIGAAVEALELFLCCSEPEEWADRITWLPL